MAAKMGRPKLNDPKNVQIVVRIKTETMGRLKEYCDTERVTIAESIRRAIKMLLDKK